MRARDQIAKTIMDTLEPLLGRVYRAGIVDASTALMAPMKDESEVDLLVHIELEIACNICHATYKMPASIVRESQRILAEGCSGGSLYECDASFFATLIEPEAVADLERAWASFQQSATGHGAVRVTVSGNGAQPRELDERAVQRWENEGGHCKHVRAALAERVSTSSASSSSRPGVAIDEG